MILIIEIIYLLFFINVSLTFSVKSLASFGMVLFSVFLVWKWIKNNLIKLKELKEFNIKANRFIRNYKIFKLVLKSKNKFELPYTPVVLDSKTNGVEITIITSPFCGFCARAHEVLNNILSKHGNFTKLKILFNTELENIPETSKSLFRNLFRIYMEEGEESFRKSFDTWYKTKNIVAWLETYNKKYGYQKIDMCLAEQHKWCAHNKFNFTPAVFINGYAYPKEYDLENLEYYINELIGDTEL